MLTIIKRASLNTVKIKEKELIYHLLSEDDRMLTDNKERAELFNSVLVQFLQQKSMFHRKL